MVMKSSFADMAVKGLHTDVIFKPLIDISRNFVTKIENSKRFTLDDDCLHNWSMLNDTHNFCPKCNGLKVWVSSHKRGDEKLGVMSQEYNVISG